MTVNASTLPCRCALEFILFAEHVSCIKCTYICEYDEYKWKYVTRKGQIFARVLCCTECERKIEIKIKQKITSEKEADRKQQHNIEHLFIFSRRQPENVCSSETRRVIISDAAVRTKAHYTLYCAPACLLKSTVCICTELAHEYVMISQRRIHRHTRQPNASTDAYSELAVAASVYICFWRIRQGRAEL